MITDGFDILIHDKILISLGSSQVFVYHLSYGQELTISIRIAHSELIVASAVIIILGDRAVYLMRTNLAVAVRIFTT